MLLFEKQAENTVGPFFLLVTVTFNWLPIFWPVKCWQRTTRYPVSLSTRLRSSACSLSEWSDWVSSSIALDCPCSHNIGKTELLLEILAKSPPLRAGILLGISYRIQIGLANCNGAKGAGRGSEKPTCTTGVTRGLLDRLYGRLADIKLRRTVVRAAQLAIYI